MKNFVRRCVICRKFEGTPYSLPPQADLSSDRVSEEPPFTHVGLDFAGPLFIETKTYEGADNESKKVFICLFTFASTRAMHLELPSGQSVEAFLLARRRFTGRRGVPATLHSDNAKTFANGAPHRPEIWTNGLSIYLL